MRVNPGRIDPAAALPVGRPFPPGLARSDGQMQDALAAVRRAEPGWNDLTGFLVDDLHGRIDSWRSLDVISQGRVNRIANVAGHVYLSAELLSRRPAAAGGLPHLSETFLEMSRSAGDMLETLGSPLPPLLDEGAIINPG